LANLNLSTFGRSGPEPARPEGQNFMPIDASVRADRSPLCKASRTGVSIAKRSRNLNFSLMLYCRSTSLVVGHHLFESLTLLAVSENFDQFRARKRMFTFSGSLNRPGEFGSLECLESKSWNTAPRDPKIASFATGAGAVRPVDPLGAASRDLCPTVVRENDVLSAQGVPRR